MKKSIFTIIGLLVVFVLNAQVTSYEQDFEVNPLLMPTEITLINVDGMQPDPTQSAGYADSAWIIGTSATFGSQIAKANSWHVDEVGDADDWMMMPTFSITSDQATVSWDAMSLTSSGNYPDDYMVIAVEAPAEAPADTVDYVLTNGTILQQVTAEAYEAPVHYEILLSDHSFAAGQDIWVIFRLTTPAPGGSELGIDNIMLSNGTGINTSVERLTGLYPNPVTDGFVTIDVPANKAKVHIFDLTGKLIQESELNGSNVLNVQDVISGAYIVKVTAQNKVYTTRMIVE
ncbi:MAG: hypothetical protein C0599_03795 [Salinivirgaceae bacterium]|nr:MAG: hypothetical protein C0599_03795 [Salinivirgaceae bacterium]